MSNELRDRIESAIRSGLDGYGTVETAAQRVIDELGLSYSFDGAWKVPNDVDQMIPTQVRVVGEWEKWGTD